MSKSFAVNDSGSMKELEMRCIGSLSLKDAHVVMYEGKWGIYTIRCEKKTPILNPDDDACMHEWGEPFCVWHIHGNTNNFSTIDELENYINGLKEG